MTMKEGISLNMLWPTLEVSELTSVLSEGLIWGWDPFITYLIPLIVHNNLAIFLGIFIKIKYTGTILPASQTKEMSLIPLAPIACTM